MPRLAVIAANPRGAIYGTIITSAVTAATAAEGKSPVLILTAAAATLLVFWLAHVYADFVDRGLRHGSSSWRDLASSMGHELSMLAAPVPSIVFLLLGALGVLSVEWAVRLALWTGVAQLFGWGIDAGRRGGRTWQGALGVGVVNAAFGIAIVVLEVLLH